MKCEVTILENHLLLASGQVSDCATDISEISADLATVKVPPYIAFAASTRSSDSVSIFVTIVVGGNWVCVGDLASKENSLFAASLIERRD